MILFVVLMLICLVPGPAAGIVLCSLSGLARHVFTAAGNITGPFRYSGLHWLGVDGSRGFAFIHCGNPTGLGLMSRESRWYGMGRLWESRGVEVLKVLADLRVIASDKETKKKMCYGCSVTLTKSSCRK